MFMISDQVKALYFGPILKIILAINTEMIGYFTWDIFNLHMQVENRILRKH